MLKPLNFQNDKICCPCCGKARMHFIRHEGDNSSIMGCMYCDEALHSTSQLVTTEDGKLGWAETREYFHEELGNDPFDDLFGTIDKTIITKYQ